MNKFFMGIFVQLLVSPVANFILEILNTKFEICIIDHKTSFKIFILSCKVLILYIYIYI